MQNKPSRSTKSIRNRKIIITVPMWDLNYCALEKQDEKNIKHFSQGERKYRLSNHNCGEKLLLKMHRLTLTAVKHTFNYLQAMLSVQLRNIVQVLNSFTSSSPVLFPLEICFCFLLLLTPLQPVEPCQSWWYSTDKHNSCTFFIYCLFYTCYMLIIYFYTCPRFICLTLLSSNPSHVRLHWI